MPGDQAVEDDQRVNAYVHARPGAQLQLAASLQAEANEVQRRILQAATAFDAALAAASLVSGRPQACSMPVEQRCSCSSCTRYLCCR